MFSQRKGLRPAVKPLQVDDIDNDLRTGLWSALHVCIWERIEYSNEYVSRSLKTTNLYSLCIRYWHHYFKRPIDNLSHDVDDVIREVRSYVFKCPWNELYDFLEFTAKNAPDNMADKFTDFCNGLLARENSAYRFVDNQIVEISSPDEIESIEQAIKNATPFGGVREHLQSALALLSDRKKPDYRNSIKEAISAVEAVCRTLSGNPKASLGEALQVFEERKSLHPALKKSLSALYGYTSDEQGIRHAMLEEPDLSSTDARFMLVACSAFVNYLIGKSAEIGLRMKKS